MPPVMSNLFPMIMDAFIKQEITISFEPKSIFDFQSIVPLLL